MPSVGSTPPLVRPGRPGREELHGVLGLADELAGRSGGLEACSGPLQRLERQLPERGRGGGRRGEQEQAGDRQQSAEHRRTLDEGSLSEGEHVLTRTPTAVERAATREACGQRLLGGSPWLQTDTTTLRGHATASRSPRVRSGCSGSLHSRWACSGSSSPAAAGTSTRPAAPRSARPSSGSKATAGHGSSSRPPACCSCSARRSTGARSRWRSSSASRSSSAR